MFNRCLRAFTDIWRDPAAKKNYGLVGKQRKTRELRRLVLPAPQPRPRHRQTSESHPRQLRAMLREACCPILPSNIRKVRLTRVYTTTPRPTPETPPPSSTATRRRRIAGEKFRPRGPRLARRRRGLGPGRGVGNAQSRLRGGWKLLVALLENPRGSLPSGSRH